MAPPTGTELHQKLISLIRRRMRAAEEGLSNRWEAWRRSERTYRLYVNPDELQGPQQAVTDNAELLYTYPSSIVVPLSYSMVQTLVSFWVTLFTTNKPYLQVGYRDAMSKGAAKAQELLLTYQLDWNGFVPVLYNWFLDACRYGVGVISNSWDIVQKMQTVRSKMLLPGPMGPIEVPNIEKRPVLEYEGNVVENIDPFAWRNDHRWPVARFQRGTFCGEELWRSMMELKARQAQGIYQNVNEIPRYSQEHFKENTSDRDRIVQINNRYGMKWEDPSDGMVLVEQLQMDVIPSEYGLSDSQDVERWVFTVANKAVVMRADPFDFDHGDFTFCAIESSPDIHALANPGIMEVMEPVSQHVTWFVNTMIENARKSLNDRLVVDPAIVNMDDLMNPSAGKVIRINREYWGMPNAISSGVKQLQVDDIAKGNMDHVGFLINLLERISAATETMQGQVEQEERTATEISSASQMGSARLRTLAKLFSAQGLAPLARQMVQNNMQLLSERQYFSIIGDLEMALQGMPLAIGGQGVEIAPEDIQGLFSFPVSDASMPLDPVRFARTWVQIMQMSASHPMLQMSVNHLAVWAEMVKSMGIPDPSRLLMPQQMQMMGQPQIDQQVQQGNLVPFDPATGGQPVQAPQPGPGGPQLKAPMPMQPQRQSVQGEENRPMR